jgi:hypothetical protein
MKCQDCQAFDLPCKDSMKRFRQTHVLAILKKVPLCNIVTNRFLF